MSPLEPLNCPFTKSRGANAYNMQILSLFPKTAWRCWRSPLVTAVLLLTWSRKLCRIKNPIKLGTKLFYSTDAISAFKNWGYSSTLKYPNKPFTYKTSRSLHFVAFYELRIFASLSFFQTWDCFVCHSVVHAARHGGRAGSGGGPGHRRQEWRRGTRSWCWVLRLVKYVNIIKCIKWV